MSDLLINQIAAGEVIERPVSIVKELIENSLDADATRITIEVEDAGVKLIRIRDNGCGITAADLPLALCRHATSKISIPSDLATIRTLGFRGEALASIGAVAECEVISRTAATEIGWRIAVYGNTSPQAAIPAPHPIGTTVEVRNVFFNLPARRKFLRSQHTEFLHIHQLVKRFALGWPQVAWRLSHNRRTIMQTFLSTDTDPPRALLAQVCGDIFVKNAIEVNELMADIRVKGWLLPPENTAARPDSQYLYINGRNIRDRVVNHAIRMAYACEGNERQPAYVLHLDLAPELFDVNVHPSKCEVRFRDNRQIHDIVYSAVTRSLTGTAILSAYPAPANIGQAEFSYRYRGEADDPDGGVAEPTLASPGYAIANDAGHLSSTDLRFGQTRCLLNQRYLLAENTTGLVLVDVLAAQRWLFKEKLQAARHDHTLSQRPLLIPVSTRLTGTKLARVIGYQCLSASFGVDIVLAGPETLMLKALPPGFRLSNNAQLLDNIIEAFLHWDIYLSRAQQETLFLEMLVRHYDGQRLSIPTGGDELLRRLEQSLTINNSGIWRQISYADMDRLLAGTL